jgi:hypothetical protein
VKQRFLIETGATKASTPGTNGGDRRDGFAQFFPAEAKGGSKAHTIAPPYSLKPMPTFQRAAKPPPSHCASIGTFRL